MRFLLNLKFYFKFLYIISSFLIRIFASLLVPCERINCAPCLTVLALKNDAHRVDQLNSNIDNSKPFDPYVVIPADSLPNLVIEGCLRTKDYGQVKAYILADSTEPHLAFRKVIMEHPISQNGYEYHISPFYTNIQGC